MKKIVCLLVMLLTGLIVFNQSGTPTVYAAETTAKITLVEEAPQGSSSSSDTTQPSQANQASTSSSGLLPKLGEAGFWLIPIILLESGLMLVIFILFLIKRKKKQAEKEEVAKVET